MLIDDMMVCWPMLTRTATRARSLAPAYDVYLNVSMHLTLVKKLGLRYPEMLPLSTKEALR